MQKVKETNTPDIEIPELEAYVNPEKKMKQFTLKGTDHYALLGEGKTWKQAKMRVNTIMDMCVKYGITPEEGFLKLRRKYTRKTQYPVWEDNLKRMLRLQRIPRCTVMYMLSGLIYLEPFELSDMLCVPENESLENVIRKRGGEEAVKLAKKMISDEEE